MQPHHWDAIRSIYVEGIATGMATFQTLAPEWEEWDASHVRNCRMVAVDDQRVLAWAALTPVSGRCVYAGVGEVSVYVAESARGKGIGRIILNGLIQESEQEGYWTLQAGIFPENTASVRIHQDCGFRIVGNRERIGKLNGAWRDTLLLERRSNKTGL